MHEYMDECMHDDMKEWIRWMGPGYVAPGDRSRHGWQAARAPSVLEVGCET